MKRDLKILNNLSVLAEGVEPVNSGFRVAAAIYHRGNVISYGVCATKSHPFQKKFARNEEAIYIHAENAAIVNALKKISLDELKRSTLYVARVKRPSQTSKKFIWGLAHPCEGCMRAISSFGIKNVYYTCDSVWDGKIFQKRFETL